MKTCKNCGTPIKEDEKLCIKCGAAIGVVATGLGVGASGTGAAGVGSGTSTGAAGVGSGVSTGAAGIGSGTSAGAAGVGSGVSSGAATATGTGSTFVTLGAGAKVAIVTGTAAVVATVGIGIGVLINSDEATPPPETPRIEQTSTPAPTPELTPTPTPEPTPVPPPSVGDIILFGDYDWIVLDVQDGKALIIAERVVGYWTYELFTYTTYSTTTVWSSQNAGFAIRSGGPVLTYSAPIWVTSDLRSYLNGEFFYNFSKSDRERIVEVNVENGPNPWYDTEGGDDTTDKIFLLSLSEVLRYFGDSGQLEDRPTGEEGDANEINDEYNENRMASGGSWWLRSPGNWQEGAGVREVFSEDVITQTAYVSRDGAINVEGRGSIDDNIIAAVDGSWISSGIRPAMWIELE